MIIMGDSEQKIAVFPERILKELDSGRYDFNGLRTSEEAEGLGLDYLGAIADNYRFVGLLSASPNPIIEAIGRYLKTDNYFSSELEIKNNKYTGRVIRILSNEAKKQAIHGILDHSLIKSLKLGFGDSTGDIEMLSFVDHAFVINPHQEEIKTIAKKSKWNLVDSNNIISTLKKIIK